MDTLLKHICQYRTNKVDVNHIDLDMYVSTENMLPNKQGICISKSYPESGYVNEYKQGDILISNIRPYFKKIYLAKNDGGCSADVLVITPQKGINNVFLYYLLSQDSFFDYVMSGSKGCKMPRGDKKYIMEWSIPVFDSINQQQIAGILSSLDAKIETNNKLNEKLEEMAQAIFKSWFVDFEPFKDQPFHKTELAMIPKGWEVGIFEDIANIVGGGTPSKQKQEYYTEDGIAWLTPKDLSLVNKKFTSKGAIDITKLGYEKSSAKLMPKGSVLFSSRAPIGYITIAKNEICTNQGFKSAVPQKAGTAFIYYLLKNKTPEIENMATGSTFKEASGTLMKTLRIIIPIKEVLDNFEKIMEPIFNMQLSVEEENDRLASLRDTLLPRLMSGEIKI